MISIIFRIISAALTLLITIVSYGIISWNIFGAPTFMSGGKDCMPTVYTNISAAAKESKTTSTFFREGSMFGERCVTY